MQFFHPESSLGARPFFFNFYLDTVDRIILVNLRFACWNYVPLAPVIPYISSVLRFQRFCEAVKIVSRYTDGFPCRSVGSRIRDRHRIRAFREQNYRRHARSITNLRWLCSRFIEYLPPAYMRTQQWNSERPLFNFLTVIRWKGSLNHPVNFILSSCKDTFLGL